LVPAKVLFRLAFVATALFVSLDVPTVFGWGVGHSTQAQLVLDGLPQEIRDFFSADLQRQIVHTTATLGTPKVESARRMLAALNPEVQVETINHKLDALELRAAVGRADVVIDGSDNFATRFAVNSACVAARTPLVSGAVVRFEGQVGVFRPERPDSPCYACLYRDTGAEDGDLCSQFGVLAPAAGMIGTIQATEALKVLLGIGETLTGRVLVVDALRMEFRTLTLRKDPACPVCGAALAAG